MTNHLAESDTLLFRGWLVLLKDIQPDFWTQSAYVVAGILLAAVVAFVLKAPDWTSPQNSLFKKMMGGLFLFLTLILLQQISTKILQQTQNNYLLLQVFYLWALFFCVPLSLSFAGPFLHHGKPQNHAPQTRGILKKNRPSFIKRALIYFWGETNPWTLPLEWITSTWAIRGLDWLFHTLENLYDRIPKKNRAIHLLLSLIALPLASFLLAFVILARFMMPCIIYMLSWLGLLTVGLTLLLVQSFYLAWYLFFSTNPPSFWQGAIGILPILLLYQLVWKIICHWCVKRKFACEKNSIIPNLEEDRNSQTQTTGTTNNTDALDLRQRVLAKRLSIFFFLLSYFFYLLLVTDFFQKLMQPLSALDFFETLLKGKIPQNFLHNLLYGTVIFGNAFLIFDILKSEHQLDQDERTTHP